ncbi:DsbA family protein [Aquibacillus albus]
MGKRRLEGALQQIDHPIEVTYRCFELDPTMERDVKENIYEKLSKKYGMSIEEAKANTQNMVQMAKEAGLDYQMDTLILTNTFDAHRLAVFAKKHGLMKEMTERILHAYFSESKHIGNHETLAELAEEVGLNREAVVHMLESDEMEKEVRADEQQANEYAISGVPFFLINKKYALNGAQPTEVFVQALEKVIAEDQS